MKETLIFAYYCNRPIRNSEIFRHEMIEKWNITDKEKIGRMYVQIVNYQIKKYGASLHASKGMLR